MSQSKSPKTQILVWATHPSQPNYSGHARGRKLHIANSSRKGTLTFCNMKVDHKADQMAIENPWRGICQVCSEVSK